MRAFVTGGSRGLGRATQILVGREVKIDVPDCDDELVIRRTPAVVDVLEVVACSKAFGDGVFGFEEHRQRPCSRFVVAPAARSEEACAE